MIPAALALGERSGSSGREVIEGIVAGYEVANRVAAAVHPLHTLSGFLPTGTCGTFGAAAASAKLMKLSDHECLNALGCAGYLAPMSMAEHLMEGCTVKVVQGGAGASAGILAAMLAADGVTGHHRVLEGTELKGGFTQITVRGEPVMERLVEGLGKRFTILEGYFKPYSACRHTHGAAQATLELLEDAPFTAEEVESIKVRTYGIAFVAVGKGVSEGDGFVSAQFSIPYVVAACVVDGDMGPEQLMARRTGDPVLLGLSRRVKVEMSEELNSLYPGKTPTAVEVSLRGGRKLSRQVDIPHGDPRDPMEEDEIAGKVRRFAGGDRAGVEAVIEKALALEELESVEELTGLV